VTAGRSRRGLVQEAGQLLRTTRQLRRLSQARLAQRAGTSQQWLSQVERGAVNPTLDDLERFFRALRLRLRLETVDLAEDAATDPDLAFDLTEEDRCVMLSGIGYLLGRLADTPHLVGGRLAAFAHGLPVRVHRLDLIVTHDERSQFARGFARLNAVRWNDRWQEYRDHLPADRPGPMRWFVGSAWELRVALVHELPAPVRVRLDDLDLKAPPLPWLLDHDPDVAGLASRLRAVGWSDDRA
jgi:transcriptional regulator with XRE-family HTH domain